MLFLGFGCFCFVTVSTRYIGGENQFLLRVNGKECEEGKEGFEIHAQLVCMRGCCKSQ